MKDPLFGGFLFFMAFGGSQKAGRILLTTTALFASSPRSFLAVGFPLLSLTQFTLTDANFM
ncbi:hypothetical protein [Flavobacterium sp.]|uniref:hypothetical protein n=1 Tax=Flavobacterium sp. TaxID=239 RepID=UPI0039E52A34